jgi:hypothetical protein
MSTAGNTRRSGKIDLFISKERQARFWMLVAFAAVIGFAWDRQNLVTKLTSKPLFFAMDANTFYVSRLGTFEEAKLFHAEASRMAAACLFDRNPAAPDYIERLKLLFGRDAYLDAERTLAVDSQKVQEQRIHQKIEIGKIDILKQSSDIVLTAVHGQIIQAGVFDGRQFSNSKPVTVYFQLGLNQEMASNSRYPEFVMMFDIHAGEE